jgi:hypothetical protein
MLLNTASGATDVQHPPLGNEAPTVPLNRFCMDVVHVVGTIIKSSDMGSS